MKQRTDRTDNSFVVEVELAKDGELSIMGTPLPVLRDVISLRSHELGRTPIPGEELPMQSILLIQNRMFDLITGSLAWLGCAEGMALTLVLCVFSSPDPFLNIAIWISICELCNGFFKWVMQHPRPFWLYSPIHTVSWALEKQYSFPSGHSQGFMFMASACLCEYGFNVWTSLLLITAILGGLSRIYLGVHFLHDVLVGWSVGAFIGYLSSKCNLMTWFLELDIDSKMILSVSWMLIIPLALLVIRHEFPDHPQEFIELWTENMRKNCKKEVEWRCREMHQYMQEYGFILGGMWSVIINEKRDLQIGWIFFNEKFETFENIWPRVLIGTSIVVLNIAAFEVLKHVKTLRKVPLTRLFILFVLKLGVGFCTMLLMPWLAEKHEWTNSSPFLLPANMNA